MSTLIPGIEPKLLINSGIDLPEEVFCLIVSQPLIKIIHVRKILNLYYPFINVNGYIFIDDTSSYPFRRLNILTDSINSDLCKEEVEEFTFN